MYNDSFQYLSVARNLLEGNGLASSLLYFDEQLASGLMPAPQTAFPPGYSVVIAVLGAAGIALETAAYAVSVVSHVTELILFVRGARLLNVWTPALVFLWLVLAANVTGWILAFSVLSESLFTAVSLGAMVLLIRAETASQTRKRRALIAGAALAGLSVWVRYAGLFLVAGGGLFYSLCLLRRRRGDLGRLLLFASVSAAGLVPLLARNLLLAGDFRGGNTLPVDKPAAAVVAECGHALLGLFSGTTSEGEPGPGPLATPGQLALALVVCLGLYAILCWQSVSAGLRRSAALLLTCYVLAYLGGLLYCGKYSPISLDDPRMLYPLLPVALLLLGAACPQAAPRTRVPISLAAVGALLPLACLAYPAAQLLSTVSGPFVSAEDEIVAAARQPIGGQPSLDMWIARHVGPHDTVIANDGQAFGYTYDRRTIGLASRRYSGEAWTAERLRRVARTYRARLLFLFPDSADFQVLAAESPFLQSLVKGNGLPDWTTPLARSRGCTILKLDCAPDTERDEPGK